VESVLKKKRKAMDYGGKDLKGKKVLSME